MRSAMGKDFVREISHTRSRFLSILVLVALSVAFLSGLRSTAPDTASGSLSRTGSPARRRFAWSAARRSS